MLLTVQGVKGSFGRDVMLYNLRGKGSFGRDVILQTVQGGQRSFGRDVTLLTMQVERGRSVET